MSTKDLKAAYSRIEGDSFPARMEITFDDDAGTRQTLFYEKASWEIDGERRGLRYGENPGQEAALYRLVNGNLALGETECIKPGRWLASDMELLQSGKHPGKINVTDVDSALNIMRYISDRPCCAIMKHNNPCGVAVADTIARAYDQANMADRLAAFGGAIALNREVDVETARLIAANYAEVVAAPGYAPGSMEILAKRKNLRIVRINNLGKLGEYASRKFIEFKSLIDGGIITQWSFQPKVLKKTDFMAAEAEYKGETYRIGRRPTDEELDDLLFGWLVETGITSNSVVFVKKGVTVGIGTGEQDRVGVAEIARDKAYRKLADRLCWEKRQTPYNALDDDAAKTEIDDMVREMKGGLIGSSMISDGFFPFRDGVDVGIREGVTAIAQPGGSLRDFESIVACNESGVAMVYTGQRCFRH